MKREFVVVSLAVLVLFLFISSILFLRFNSNAVVATFKKIPESIVKINSKKNLNNSTFVPEKALLNQLKNCGVEVKADLNSLKIVTRPEDSSSVERFTLQEDIANDIDQKIGSFDIICIEFDKSFEQLRLTLNNVNAQNPETIKNFFGASLEEVLKLDKKELYKTFLVKRSQNKECNVKTNIVNYKYIQSKVEATLDDSYIECIYNQKDKDGKLLRVVNIDYLFDKSSKFIIQIGNADADNIFDKLLLIK